MGSASPRQALLVWVTGILVWAAVAAPDLAERVEGAALGPWRDAQLAALAPLVGAHDLVTGWLAQPAAAGEADAEPAPSAPSRSRPAPPSDGPPPSAPPSPSTARPSPSPAPTPTASPSPTPRGASQDDPLRVLVVGDSTATDLGWALQSVDTLPLEVTTDTRPATGLARPDHFDWQAQLAADLERDHPELVVVMLGANDSQGFLIDGRPMLRGTPEWRAAYAERVRRFISLAGADGRDVLWVGLPIMADPDFAEQMRVLNEIYAAEARDANVTYVDAWALLAVDGRYAPFLPDAEGLPQPMRQPDGIHLSIDGAKRLAEHVIGVVAVRWELALR